MPKRSQHEQFVCLVRLSEPITITSLYSIKRLFHMMDMGFDLCEERDEFFIYNLAKRHFFKV